MHHPARSLHTRLLVATLVIAGAAYGPLAAQAAGVHPSTGPATTLIGVLTRQAQRECLADGTVRWVDPHYQVGFVRLVLTKGLVPAAHVGRVVQVRGHTVSGRWPKVRSSGPCPIAQMRSDWVEGPGGMRIRRDGGFGLAAFRALSIRRFEALQAQRRGAQLVIRLTNKLKTKLVETRLRLHYEGCHGKPGTMHADQTFAAIKVGQTVTARFPVHGRRPGGAPGRSLFSVSSLQVSSKTAGVSFALDWYPGRPDLKLGCPRR